MTEIVEVPPRRVVSVAYDPQRPASGALVRKLVMFVNRYFPEQVADVTYCFAHGPFAESRSSQAFEARFEIPAGMGTGDLEATGLDVTSVGAERLLVTRLLGHRQEIAAAVNDWLHRAALEHAVAPGYRERTVRLEVVDETDSRPPELEVQRVLRPEGAAP